MCPLKPVFKSFITCMVLMFMISMSSCTKYVLFQQNAPIASQPDTSVFKSDDSKQSKVLMPDDKIMVSIWDHDELSVGSLQGTYSLAEEFGKWVMLDVNGEVRLPQVGTVKLQGMTLKEATAQLEKVYSKFIQNPVITIRILNNEVTILGEVRSPGIYLFSADHVKLTDLIAKAQGLTDYAKTKKIKIVRNNQELVIDLTNTASVSQQSYTIYPGDVIYIPPTAGKGWDRFSSRLIPIASLITAIALVYSVTDNQ